MRRSATPPNRTAAIQPPTTGALSTSAHALQLFEQAAAAQLLRAEAEKRTLFLRNVDELATMFGYSMEPPTAGSNRTCSAAYALV